MNLLETVVAPAHVDPASAPISARSVASGSSSDLRPSLASSQTFQYLGIPGSCASRGDGPAKGPAAVQPSGAPGLPGQRKDVPALSSTVLQLELLLGMHNGSGRFRASCSINLGAAGALVLSDLGATVQVLRLAGRKHQRAEDRPRSIEHCIANFNTQTWFDAVAAPPFARDHAYAVAASLWEHSQIIAHYAKLIATSTDGVNPDEAYLCGLLHDLGKLPSALGWDSDYVQRSESPHLGAMLAREWCLPGFIIDALDGQSRTASDLRDASRGGRSNLAHRIPQMSGPGWTGSRHKPWTEILSTAHELAVTFDGKQPGLQ